MLHALLLLISVYRHFPPCTSVFICLLRVVQGFYNCSAPWPGISENYPFLPNLYPNSSALATLTPNFWLIVVFYGHQIRNVFNFSVLYVCNYLNFKAK